MADKANKEFKGCRVTNWEIKTRFVQEVKIEPSILVDVTGMSDSEIQELYDEVNKDKTDTQWQES